MRVALYCHTLRSDWNHGNAHFLRGVVTELQARGHDVRVFEPEDAWSVENLVRDHGQAALRDARTAYPTVLPTVYRPGDHDLDAALDDVDLCLVHEWNEPALVRAIGRVRAGSRRLRVLFHDTHHRSVTDPSSMAAYDLTHYDGVLAFGEVVREIYLDRGWAARVFVWHEAADIRVFYPRAGGEDEGDLVWVGNWGDDERTAELESFLLRPAEDLGLRTLVHGVRYPSSAVRALLRAGIRFGGWLPNFRVPEVFSRHRFTVHVPRRPYAERLPGIPTIRPFEAMASGIPLISAPWTDSEGLFEDGRDYLLATDEAAMRRHMRLLRDDAAARAAIASCARATILARHTCAHRVDELLRIAAALGATTDKPCHLQGAPA